MRNLGTTISCTLALLATLTLSGCDQVQGVMADSKKTIHEAQVNIVKASGINDARDLAINICRNSLQQNFPNRKLLPSDYESPVTAQVRGLNKYEVYIDNIQPDNQGQESWRCDTDNGVILNLTLNHRW